MGLNAHGAAKCRWPSSPLGHLLALPVTAAEAQDRAQVGRLAARVPDVTRAAVDLVCVDHGDTDDQPAQDAAAQGMRLAVVTRPEAKQGFVLLPRRWVVERRVGWAARVRRLARDDERLPATLAGFHCLAFVILLLTRVVETMVQRA